MPRDGVAFQVAVKVEAQSLALERKSEAVVFRIEASIADGTIPNFAFDRSAYGTFRTDGQVQVKAPFSRVVDPGADGEADPIPVEAFISDGGGGLLGGDNLGGDNLGSLFRNQLFFDDRFFGHLGDLFLCDLFRWDSLFRFRLIGLLWNLIGVGVQRP